MFLKAPDTKIPSLPWLALPSIGLSCPPLLWLLLPSNSPMLFPSLPLQSLSKKMMKFGYLGYCWLTNRIFSTGKKRGLVLIIIRFLQCLPPQSAPATNIHKTWRTLTILRSTSLPGQIKNGGKGEQADTGTSM